jgi:hypothetical protein
MAVANIVQLLCDLSEASEDVFRDTFFKGDCCQHIKTLTDMGLIEPGPTPDTITCAACDADHVATLEYDPGRRRYTYFCPEAGWVAADDADLVTYRFRPEWVADWLVKALPITSPVQRPAIVPEFVWYLGDATCGVTSVTVIFARRMSSQVTLDRLASELRTIHPAEKGLILTTAMRVPRHLRLPGGFEMLPLAEIIRAGGDSFSVDKQRLGRWLRGIEQTTAKGARTRSGRPSPQASIVAQIYDERRQQRLPISSERAEARAILEAWRQFASDRTRPHLSTVRRYVANLIGAAVSE